MICEKSGKAIGVAVADTPTGPFKDARGTALVTNDMTTATKISWDDIDPTVWIDDDKQAWLFWGNQKCYYAKLKPNMTELDGRIEVIPDGGRHADHFVILHGNKLTFRKDADVIQVMRLAHQ